MDWNRPATLREQAGTLLDRYSLRATRFILDKLREFARRRKRKKLLVVLFDPYRAMAEMKQSGTRYDQESSIVWPGRTFLCFDMNVVYIFARFQKLPDCLIDYIKQLLHRPLQPRRNHFFAYAIKDVVIESA